MMANLIMVNSFASSNVAGFAEGGVLNVIAVLRFICVVVGVGLLVGAVVKFSGYRRNPEQVKLMDVFVLLAVGAAMIGISYIPMGGY